MVFGKLVWIRRLHRGGVFILFFREGRRESQCLLHLRRGGMGALIERLNDWATR